MKNLTIGIKLAAGYLVLVLLVLVVGGTGFIATQQLSGALDTITGPVNGTSTAVARGIKGVQTQMLGVELALRTDKKNAALMLEMGATLANDAYKEITSLELITAEHRDALGVSLDEFGQVRESLLRLNESYRESKAGLDINFARIKDLLVRVEELASQRLVDAEFNMNVAEDEETGTRDSEEWAVVLATTEARLALLTRLYEYNRLLDDPTNSNYKEAAEAALGDFNIYIEEIGEAGMLANLKVGKGPYADKTYTSALNGVAAQHETIFNEAQSQFHSLTGNLEKYKKVADSLMDLANKIEMEANATMNQEVANADETTASAEITIIAMLLISLGIAAAAYFLNVRGVVKPIVAAADRMSEISSGDGDLTVRLKVKGNDELACLSRSFNSFVEKIQQTVTEVSNSVAQLTMSTNQLNQLNDAGVSRIQIQQNDTMQVTTAMNQMTATVAEVAESTEHALQSALDAESQASEGRTIVSSTIQAIETLASRVEDATNTIHELEKDSDAIGSVVDVIGGIAEQTNLLALNAAIEAARAGEQGRGFAVVADEVRTLASRTQESTLEIKKMIDKLQTGAKAAATVMDENQSQAQETVTEGGMADSSLGQILDSVSNIHGMNQQIASAAEEQSTTAIEISTKVSSINDASGEIVHNAGEMTNAIQSLASLSNQLDDLVRNFRV